MKTRLLALLVSVVSIQSFCFSSPVAGGEGRYLNLDNAHLGVWNVGYEKRAGGRWQASGNFGTAFAIGPDLFLTNAHVIRSATRIGARLDQIKLYQTKGGSGPILEIDQVLGMTEVHDLAYFRTKTRIAAYFPLFRGLPDGQLEPLTAVGYPGDSFRRMQSIAKASFQDSPFYDFSVALDLPVHLEGLQGASGGPVLSADGRLVGVMKQGSKNIAHCIRLEKVIEFVELGHEGVDCSSATLGDCLASAAKKLSDAARVGHPLAQFRLWHAFDRKLIYGSQTTFIRLLKQSAESGYAPAQYSIGWRYLDGNGVTESSQLGEAWIERSARSGFAAAQYTLADRYRMRNDMRSARWWLEQAVAQGYRPAQELLDELAAGADN